MLTRTKTILILLLTLTMAWGGGFRGHVSTDQGNPVPGAVISGKHINTVLADTTTDASGDYLLEWDVVGVDPFDLKLPGTRLLGLGNSVSSDGHITAYFNGATDRIDFNVYDIRGREVSGSSHFTQGKYFLRAFDKETGKNLGVRSFVLMSDRLQIELISDQTKPGLLGKSLTDQDSLIVELDREDFKIERWAGMVHLTDDYQVIDPVVIRKLQSPELHITRFPDSVTIDTVYTLLVDAFNPDYDCSITDLYFEQISGDSVNSTFNGSDTLELTFLKRGSYSFRLTATDTRGEQVTEDLVFDVSSLHYSLALTKLLYGLGLPRAGIDVGLCGKTIRTGADGLAEFEFPVGYGLSILDSVTLEDNILGSLQKGTGPFVEFKFPIKTEYVNSEVPHVVQTFTDEMTRRNPDYWDDYVWANQADREFYLLGLVFNQTYVLARRGSVEDGYTDLFHYSPEHYYNYGEGITDYRAVNQIILDSIHTAIDDLAKDDDFNGGVPFNFVNVSPDDSMLAIDHGNTFDYSRTNSSGKYKIIEVDPLTGFPYITRSGQYVNGGAGELAVAKVMAHELGRAIAYVAVSPYDPDHPEYINDVMLNGCIRPHDMVGYYFMMNANQDFFLMVRDLRSILPNSEPYFPDN